MSRDIYASVSGAVTAWRHLDLIANNLANVNTTGFKSFRMAFDEAGQSGHPLGRGYVQGRLPTRDASDGNLQQDGVPTHLAIRGFGYFVVQTGSQAPTLTRDGRFMVSPNGELVDVAGFPVLGEGGAIRIPPGEAVTITTDGRVFTAESGEIDRLRVVDGPVREMGSNRYVAVGALQSVDSQVVQGALEASNVDPMSVMIELVQSSRYFEAYQKAMQSSDELDARLNQFGGQ
jgi:flagellar basal-body rod protein FlgF